MKELNEDIIKLLNIQIGCILRYARLKKGISQHSLSLMLNTNPTMIGRIERFENHTTWDKLYLMSKCLDVDFCDLFNLRSKEDLLQIVKDSYELEDKLTQEKTEYYNFLKTNIIKKYNLIQKQR